MVINKFKAILGLCLAGKGLLAQTLVGGPISGNTTWNLAGSPYIVQSNAAVLGGATLTIDPGVVVKFDSQKSIQFFGTLRAIGTAAQPIQFTSNQTTPNPGDWGYMLFNNTCPAYNFSTGQGTIMSYCTVEYAGNANITYNGALRMDNSYPYLNNCILQYNSKTAVTAWNLVNDLHIDSCLFQHNSSSSGTVYTENGALIMKGCTLATNLANAGVYGNQTTLKLIKNHIVSNTSYGVRKTWGTPRNRDTLIGNIITNNSLDGVSYDINTNVLPPQFVYMSTNTINNNLSYGVIFNGASDSIIYKLTDNTLIHNSYAGVYFNFLGGQVTRNTISLIRNTLNNNGSHGVYFNYINVWSDSVAFDFISNIIHNNTGNGLYQTGQYAPGRQYTRIDKNSIVNNQGTGIYYNFTQGYAPGQCPLSFTSNIIANNHNGGILLDFRNMPTDTFLKDTILMKNNIIVRNTGANCGGISILAGQGGPIMYQTITSNVIAENTSGAEGGGICMNEYTNSNQVYYNAIIGNVAPNSPGIYSSGTGNVLLHKNTIVYNQNTGTNSSRMVYIQKPQLFTNNNIYPKTCSPMVDLWYDDFNGAVLNAQQCYWKKNTSAGIDSVVWDFFDDQNLGIVDYTNFITLPDTGAPVAPVLNVTKTNLGGGQLKVSWAPNLETDIAGYRVYWGSPTGYSFANVANAGNATNYTITANVTDTIAVTAYDIYANGVTDQAEGHESWFSGDDTCSFTIGIPPVSRPLPDPAFYPNPSSNGIFHSHNLQYGEEVRILSLTGAEVANTRIYNNTLDLNGLAPGAYLVEVKGNEAYKKQKLFILSH